MGPKFFQTVMGRRFIEGIVPNLLSELTKLNKNLEELNKNLEKNKSDSKESVND